ncbi:MAG: hypothetical protein HLUCCO02_05280 [Idiomarinaceae bacterium HL-53]|nr:MAG: hypothetical protein HLUCCO02_05280 [Idiomarinaceae bacterium HL-53]
MDGFPHQNSAIGVNDSAESIVQLESSRIFSATDQIYRV